MQHSELTANINQAQCIVEKHFIGKSVFYNICTGKTSEVPWTPVDWGTLAVAVVAGFFIIRVAVGVLSRKTS